MIKNYLTIAWRTIYKSKSFSIINIFGLSISMAVCLLVIMLLADQYSTDSHNPLKDRIYRINSNYKTVQRSNSLASAPLALADALGTELSVIDDIVTIRDGAGGDADIGTKIVPVAGYYASKKFFEILDFELIRGDKSTALADPYSIVLTEAAAIKLYGHLDVVSKSISIKDQGDYTVTGVLKKPEWKSHVDGFEILISSTTIPSLEENKSLRRVSDNWDAYYQSYVYLLLNESAKLDDVVGYMDRMAEEKYADRESFSMSFSLQSLMSINPYDKELGNQLFFAMPKIVIYVLSGLALLIMLSAAFNYTNLSIARALVRAREIGIRKVSGANRFQIFGQFIIESVVVSLISLIFAAILLYFLIPAFYSLDPHIHQFMSLKDGPEVWMMFLLFSILVGLAGGIFPAIYLSSFNPVAVLKSLTGIKLFSKINVRKALIVAQFSLSMMFIITTFIMNNQFKYSLNYDLGFNKENLVNIELYDNEYETVANELRSIPGVEIVSGSKYVMGIGRLWAEQMRNPDQIDSSSVAFQKITLEYLQNLGHTFVAGNNFPEGFTGENEEFVIVNETLVKYLGYGDPQSAIGQQLITEEGEPMIIGVIKDFHFNRLERPIEPFVFKMEPDYEIAHVRIASGNPGITIMEMEHVWKKLDTVHEFTYDFYDEQIREAYSQYLLLTKMVGFFAFLAISIACLGLLGMAVYTTELRTKEVGIRKVLGAEVSRIVLILSRSFIWLLIIAAVIAVPAAWFLNDLFLSDFANRAPIGPFLLMKGVLLMLVLGLIIICSQTIRAAMRNPASTLRNE